MAHAFRNGLAIRLLQPAVYGLALNHAIAPPREPRPVREGRHATKRHGRPRRPRVANDPARLTGPGSGGADEPMSSLADSIPSFKPWSCFSPIPASPAGLYAAVADDGGAFDARLR